MSRTLCAEEIARFENEGVVFPLAVAFGAGEIGGENVTKPEHLRSRARDLFSA